MQIVKNLTTIQIGYDTYICPTDKLQSVVAALALLQRADREYIDGDYCLVKAKNPEHNMSMRDCVVFDNRDEFLSHKESEE